MEWENYGVDPKEGGSIWGLHLQNRSEDIKEEYKGKSYTVKQAIQREQRRVKEE